VQTREAVAQALTAARGRTLGLTGHDEPELLRQHSPLMSPLVWDLAHVAQQEDLWLLRAGDARRPGLLPPQVESLYDAFVHPRVTRVRLPLLPPVEARRYGVEVRGRVLDALDRDEELFPYSMVVQHEQQHDETMLATLQLRQGVPLLGEGAALPSGRRVAGSTVLVPAGEAVLGVTAAEVPESLDNERPAFATTLPAYRIGRVPVTNREWQAFVDDGGYAERRWWSAAGWQHRRHAGLQRPAFWSPEGTRVRFGHVEQLPPDEPVQHVCYFEAEAYCAWAGGRLPTEHEWEKACAWDPVAGRRRRWPWGDASPTARHANLADVAAGLEALRPAPVGAYPEGASAYGVEQSIGDVWEWTSSPFTPWPGFTPMLYRTYSEPFFGAEHRVLRGGSWATASSAARPSFRNWDLPVRRQIFAGVRVAYDVEDAG